ncbi:hypothetical protein [Sporolactobacillus terrae]|uniref:hypothetical protein n=1 Tax=Sporolactobacillus terrae TaxID=269673 RepID=UPI001118E693|nr:hypothetical protein [Sporolactobacillus terrae]
MKKIIMSELISLFTSFFVCLLMLYDTGINNYIRHYVGIVSAYIFVTIICVIILTLILMLVYYIPGNLFKYFSKRNRHEIVLTSFDNKYYSDITTNTTVKVFEKVSNYIESLNFNMVKLPMVDLFDQLNHIVSYVKRETISSQNKTLIKALIDVQVRDNIGDIILTILASILPIFFSFGGKETVSKFTSETYGNFLMDFLYIVYWMVSIYIVLKKYSESRKKIFLLQNLFNIAFKNKQ